MEKLNLNLAILNEKDCILKIQDKINEMIGGKQSDVKVSSPKPKIVEVKKKSTIRR